MYVATKHVKNSASGFLCMCLEGGYLMRSCRSIICGHRSSVGPMPRAALALPCGVVLGGVGAFGWGRIAVHSKFDCHTQHNSRLTSSRAEVPTHTPSRRHACVHECLHPPSSVALDSSRDDSSTVLHTQPISDRCFPHTTLCCLFVCMFSAANQRLPL